MLGDGASGHRSYTLPQFARVGSKCFWGGRQSFDDAADLWMMLYLIRRACFHCCYYRSDYGAGVQIH